MKKQLETAGKTVLFAAANSGNGFKSFYPQIFGDRTIVRRYLIKGGPGTGKSTFMKRAADEAERAGLSVEYYRCSSDPASLDAVVIEGRTAFIDSTAPHCLECELAGARDEIVDLGRFWDSEKLFASRAEIETLTEAKSEAYRGAYRFLSAALAIKRHNAELIYRYVNREKMQKAAERIIGRIPRGKTYERRIGLREAIGMEGRVWVDTYEKTAKRLYTIKDDHGTGGLFLSLLATLALKNNNSIRVSFSPIDPDIPDALCFIESGDVFVVTEKDETLDGKAEDVINMKRFIKYGELVGESGRRIKREYKSNLRLYEGLLQSAVDQLSLAGECHFGLENIYKKCMDFEGLEIFTAEFLKKR